MAENNVDPELEWDDRGLDTAEDTLVAMETLLATLRAFEDVLRQQDITTESSTEYCDNFCQAVTGQSLKDQSCCRKLPLGANQALMHYAGSRNSVDHGLPLLEVYCLSINCFAAARSHLTAESDRVALVLKRLALSCFELFLSVPENEIPYEAWLQFHQSVQFAHDQLLEYGSTDLQALLQITGEGGAWSNSVLNSLLTGQPTNTEEVDAYISLEGEGFMEMRVKHLEKMGEVAKAVVLAKACAESNFISNKSTFRQTYVSLLCHLLPSEEAISEISRLDCKDVLEITCNLETEGDENTAFILCTTFLTQQLQQQNQYCTWELILLWCKLQRKLDPALLSFLERCLQLGAIAKTVHHLLYLVRVIQTEVEELGVAPSVELCVKALQLPKQDDSETRISVCKTISCLLSEDLEVSRACLLTEFLLGPSQEVFRSLEELYLRPDQKYDQENSAIPNSLRCELLLALKSYWPFDPEFWDWKTLKRHCISLLGLKPESEGEDEVDSPEKSKMAESPVKTVDLGVQNRINGAVGTNKHTSSNLLEIHKESRTFRCQICKRSVSDAQLIHHSKRHAKDIAHPCPVCLQKFNSRNELVPHLKQHMDSSISNSSLKAEELHKLSDEDEDVEPGEIHIDPSLMMYYKSTHDPEVLNHIVQQAKSAKNMEIDDEHVTFDYIYRHFNLQNRDVYPCPGTGCTKVFKHSKYLYVHLKSEHRGDENVKYFHKMRDKREKCVFCRKHFVSSYHNRKHRKVHFGERPYSCLVMGCGAHFRCSNELGLHKQTHGYQLNYQCELKGCYISYSDLGQMYHHEAQHFRDAAFTCTAPKCQKFYFSKKAFTDHLATHNIHFAEHDFQAQRKAKRKLLKSSVSAQAPNGGLHDVACFSSSWAPPESGEAKTTLVAVCFDGSKFTCGFEKCGMTFSRARDVQRHLKCAHPEHLKMENKEYKQEKERGFKSKRLKNESKGHNKFKKPFLSAKKEKKTSTHMKNHDASLLNEIVAGLCKLDLNCLPSHSDSNEPPEPVPQPDSSELSLHQAIMEKSPVVVLQKKILHVPEVEVDAASTPPAKDEGEEPQETLANAKPYVCEVKRCAFRTANSYNLLRHYTSLHGRTREQARAMTYFKSTSFRPYICQLCSKAHRDKKYLRSHYIQKHNLSPALVDKISCGSVRCEGNKTAKPLELASDAQAQLSASPKNEESPKSENEEEINSQTSENEEQGLDKSQENKEEEEEESEAGTTHQGRAKRVVAKSNLCYFLDKFSKPFHCVAKNCDAAFSTQGGLVRHLQLVHHYNRSQLLLENDADEPNAGEGRKEPAKKRPSPNSDEPQPQYKCHFANCQASYHLKSSLARHTRDSHSHPELITPKYDGCTSDFSQERELKKHVLYKHREYYDSLVVRLQSTHKNSLTGCQKKLIVTDPQSPKGKEQPQNDTQLSPEQAETPESNENEQEGRKKRLKRYNFSSFVFRSHEEALQMCQDRGLHVAYPCLVQDCDGVVRSLHSINRHYRKVHRMRKVDIEENELVLNVEQLEEMIQRKSVRSTGGAAHNGVRKMEYQTEPENSGGQAAPVSLHCVSPETQGEAHQDALGFPEEEQPSVERSGVLVGADEVLYGEPSTGGPAEEPELTASGQKQQERLSLEQIKPLLRPLTVDLSPPRSLRFITEEGFVDLSNDKMKDKLINKSVSVSIARIREPLKRKNDLSEQPSNVIETQSYDITPYKPVGFESSFLNFIKESPPIERPKWQASFKRSCSVKENNQLGISHTRRRTHSPLLKPHVVIGDFTSIQNLKSILDKALAGCGDLAIKQLQYLRPVVVLGRPVCSSTLSELFPAETNNSKMLLGGYNV